MMSNFSAPLFFSMGRPFFLFSPAVPDKETGNGQTGGKQAQKKGDDLSRKPPDGSYMDIVVQNQYFFTAT